MNTSPTDNSPELRYAEYALGVLDAAARAEVEREMAASPRVAAAVAAWQQRLQPLVDEITPATPPEYVWHRIRQELDLLPAATPKAPSVAAGPGVWGNLHFWHWLGLGASAVAAVCIVLLVVLVPTWQPQPATPAVGYMASTLAQSNGKVGWTATMDVAHARMIVVPAHPQAIKAGHAPELWLIPKGHKPIAVGMITGDAPTTLSLAPALVAKLGPTAALAVSVEPRGGSPTGQPTGAVIAEGAISASNGAKGAVVSLRDVNPRSPRNG